MAGNAASCYAVEVSDTTMLPKDILLVTKSHKKSPQAVAYGLIDCLLN
jgi:hypothetical protein